MKKHFRHRFIYYGLIIYVLAASIWWSFLLLNQDSQLTAAKIENIRLQEVRYGKLSEAEFQQTKIFKDLNLESQKHRKMIYGEGAVFFIVLIIGMWFLNRGFRKEVALARQQRNFLLSITHELKSPIASIKLALDTFMKRPNLKPEQIQMLTKGALTETERLHNLVNNILLAARIENSFQILPEQLSIEQLIHDNLRQVRTKFPNVRFDFQTIGKIPTLEVDRLGLNSVVVNLLENAVKYSPTGDEVKIKLYKEGTNIVFEVADKGVGITDENKTKVFEKFYRVGNEDTRKTKGTGLGLYIVKTMLQAHQGNVTILDNQPRGTIFKVALPV